jgi:GxxExxY protein
LIEKELTGQMIGSFFTVYNDMGYGFQEAPYANALAYEMQSTGLSVQREVPIELVYAGQVVGLYRIDMLVEGRILVETKASEKLAESSCRQVFNYLRASKLNVALLFHFGPRPTFKRFVWTGRKFLKGE